MDDVTELRRERAEIIERGISKDWPIECIKERLAEINSELAEKGSI